MSTLHESSKIIVHGRAGGLDLRTVLVKARSGRQGARKRVTHDDIGITGQWWTDTLVCPSILRSYFHYAEPRVRVIQHYAYKGGSDLYQCMFEMYLNCQRLIL